MKNKNWQAIHEVYTKLETFCGEELRKPALPSLEEIAQYGEKNTFKPNQGSISIEADKLVYIRTEIRTQLDFLKTTLDEHFSERDCYLTLFPVVAQIDELIQTNYLQTMQTSWPLLQKELFQIENAGNVFYEILDDILLKPQTPIFIYEVYFFCLSYGFRGCYLNKPVKIVEYMKNLQLKIKYDEQLVDSVEEKEIGRLKYFGTPAWYYLIPAGAILGAYFLFMLVGQKV